MWEALPRSVCLSVAGAVGLSLASSLIIMANHAPVIALELAKLQGLVWCF